MVNLEKSKLRTLTVNDFASYTFNKSIVFEINLSNDDRMNNSLNAIFPMLHVVLLQLFSQSQPLRPCPRAAIFST